MDTTNTIALISSASWLAVMATPLQTAAQGQHPKRPGCLMQSSERDAQASYLADPWTDGLVYYEFDVNVTPENQLNALAAMDEIEAVCNAQFVAHTDEQNFIRIRNASGNSSGCVGEPDGLCNINIHDWEVRFLIAHELMHALGLLHEQKRHDRDEYIELNWDKIHPGWAGNFTIAPNGIDYGPYDFDSVMHYGRNLGSVDLDWTIAVRHPYKRIWQRRLGQLDHLSNGDIWALVLLYGGDPPPRAFELIFPAAGELVGSSWIPTFEWALSEAADSYRLLVDDDGSFATPEIDVVLSETSYVHGNSLPADRFYYWTVIAGNGVGETSPYPFDVGSFLTGSSVTAVIHVDDDAAPGGSGASWDDPMNDLRSALLLAEATHLVSEIRVAQGTYTPDHGTADRKLSFPLVNGVTVLGGYAGPGLPDPDERNITVYETVLSGDLAGDDLPDFGNNEENSNRVVDSVDVDATAVLDGVTVEGGNADSVFWPFYGYQMGGAIGNDEGSPVIRNCTITNSSSISVGGGIGDAFHGCLRLENCLFHSNRVLSEAPPADGGALAQAHADDAVVLGCQFTENNAAYDGGAVTLLHSDTLFLDCTFSDNTAQNGGVASAAGSAPVFVNCLFNDNAAVWGGALFNRSGVLDPIGAMTEVVNCTFTGNIADAGGAMYSTDAFGGHSEPFVYNTILWDNSPDAIVDDSGASTTVRYSDIQGGWPAGTHNIDADPLFIDPVGADYRLSPGSPCIDAALNTAVPADAHDLDGDGETTEPIPFDLDGENRFIDDPTTTDSGSGVCPLVDMGVYEYQEGTTECCPGDIDGDATVGVTDLLALLAAWGPCTGCAADLDGDGNVGVTDLLGLLAGWGPC